MPASLTGRRLGPYEVLAPLGAGGMGVVYRGRDRRLGRDVAIKVLPEAFAQDRDRLARFDREARAVAALNHPQILVLFDVGEQDGISYVVTELLEGDSLRDRLKQGPLPVRKAVECAAQAARGLAAAHERGIVHRDLKPENLFVTKDGRVKILDFGLARQTPQPQDVESPTVSHPTEPGAVMGTVGYMSPEQVRGEAVDQRSDIFSLGAILYEMLSGRRAFQAPTPAETLSAILREDPPDLLAGNPSLPPAIDRLVKHCLEKRREERLQSAHDLALYLGSVTDSTTTAPAVPPPTVKLPRPVLAAVAMLAAVAVASFLAGRRAVEPPEQPRFQQLTFRRGTLLDARFAPEGQSFVYYAAWDAPGRFKLYSGRFDSVESRPLEVPRFENPSRLFAVSSTGELAIRLQDTTLARMPLAGGAAREVLEGVEWADWSPDGKDLAVARRVGDRCRVEYPIGNLLYETADVTGLRVSRSGDQVAFFEQDGRGRMLAVVDRRGRRTVLSRGWPDAFGHAWSPDGSELWFTASREGPGRALRAVSLSGRERVMLSAPARLLLQDVSRDGHVLLTREDLWIGLLARTPREARDRELSMGLAVPAGLSEDGRSVLFWEARKDKPLFLRPTDGSPAVRLGEGGALALSPDGRWALVRASERELSLLPTGAGESRRLRVEGLTGVEGAGFFPDGKRLFLNAGGRSHVVEVAGGRPRAVTPEGVTASAASPDGRFLAGSDGTLYPVDGGQPGSIPGWTTGRVIRWSGDGRSLFVERLRSNSQADVSRVELATGRWTPVAEWVLSDPAGAGGVGPGFMTSDGKAYAFGYTRFLHELYLVEGLK